MVGRDPTWVANRDNDRAEDSSRMTMTEPGPAVATRARTPKRPRVDKFAERRNQLAEATLITLLELGYARTSLREIAQNS